MNKEITESGLTFSFEDVDDAIKFDDTPFYRSEFNLLPGGKGVDIVANSPEWIQLIEIKNCKDHEVENVWRTSINNSKIASAPHDLDVDNRDSLDIEVAKKVAMTLSCIYGSWTRQTLTEKTAEMEFIWKGWMSQKLLTGKKQLIVVLFLEGDFGMETRKKKMIMNNIQKSIKQKLKWLNCKVTVVDSNTYNSRYFSVE